MVLAWTLWLLAFVWTIGYCHQFGTNRTLDNLTFVFGIPDWVFWGILIPWLICAVLSCLFSQFVMTDAPLDAVSNVIDDGESIAVSENVDDSEKKNDAVRTETAR